MTAFRWTKEEAGALRALYATDAGRFALDIILHRLGMLNQSSFAPDPHLTAFNEGRRFVAGQLHNALTLPIDQIVKEDQHERRHGTLTATERAERHVASTYRSGGTVRWE